MISTDELNELLESGGTVNEQDGTKIGSISQVFLDDETARPEWVTVKTGMFGGAESFVPLASATRSDNEVRVAFGKDKVKDAPRVDDANGHLSKEEEAELYRYYGLEYSDSRSDSGIPAQGAPIAGEQRSGRSDFTEGHDTSGPTTDHAMTRSEEQVSVGTERVSAGKARLRKYVVTENVTTTVPVSHEEVRIEREPITDENRGDAVAGADITSEEHEVELTEERIVVDKEVVPVERVRLGTETVTEDHEVTEEVRKEQIDSDGLETDSPDQR